MPSWRREPWIAVAVAAAVGGAIVALHYQRLGLTLSHYDARGHLIVARRIFDSITPGWQQIGAVWLPLPHLLNAIPVQLNVFYRTGASGVAISIASFAVTTGAIAWIVSMLTGSQIAAVAGAAVFALNPNTLYLQATPMSESLLFGTMTLAIALLIASCRPGSFGASSPGLYHRPTSSVIGWTFALACLTRYEAWPVTASALATAVWSRHRDGRSWKEAMHEIGGIAVYPLVAIVAFLLFSRVVVGEWFVASGFFVPENRAMGHPVMALSQIVWGARMLSGYGLMAVAVVGLVALLGVGAIDPQRSGATIAASLLATGAVPWIAFVEGHPYRIRYVVPLIVAQAVYTGFAAGVWKRARPVSILVLIAVVGFELRPLDPRAPMVVEAQWDRPNVAVRQRVTDCLRSGYDGETVMASMGSLGHYMQELSRSGFDVRDFLHEGNGDIWLNALSNPRPFAGWILIEEKAEGGDMLAEITRENPEFLEGFTRVCDGAGIALYQRDAHHQLSRSGR